MCRVSKLNEYNNKIDSSKSPFCTCGRPETVTHFLEECEQYEDIRERCRIELYTATGNYDFLEELFLNVTPKQDSEDNSYSEERMKIFDKYIKYTNRFSNTPNSI